MNLLDIFTQLSHGELSTVALGGMDDDFGIREEDYEKMVSHVNFALLEITKKFQVNKKTVQFSQVEGVHTYVLDTDLLTIVSVTDTKGNPYSIDRLDESYISADTEVGDFNISTDTVGFTYDYGIDGVDFIVSYQASVPKINPIGLDPATVEIDIHPGVLQPLLYLIASRVFAGLPTLDGMNKSMDYLIKYKDACEVIQRYGLINNFDFANNKLQTRGWV